MKVLSEPSSGKRNNVVSYVGRFGQCQRVSVIPANTPSPARDHMRGSFGRLARAWSRLLTQAQRDAWNVAGPKVQSAKRLTQAGKLTGQLLFQGINSARACLGLDLLLTPPAPVSFGLNPVGQLVIRNGESGVRLLLSIAGPVVEDIMVFGQAPCSAGRAKRRNVAYLGLLPAQEAGLSDITALYIARYGQPRAGEKVFIVTRQQRDGWEGFDHETSEIVPDKPGDQQAAATAALSLKPLMHKGCTRDAQGTSTPAVLDSRADSKRVVPGGEPAGASCQHRHATHAPDRRIGAQPSGCRSVKERAGGDICHRLGMVRRVCSLKAALLCRGGSGEMRSDAAGAGFGEGRVGWCGCRASAQGRPLACTQRLAIY